MTDKRTQQQSNTETPPEDWTTGDEPKGPRMAETGDAEADAHGGDVRGVSDRE